MTLIEVIVALALLAIIITPAITFVIASGSAANEDRIRVEAINVATQTLEGIQSNANFNAISVGQSAPVETPYNENGGSLQQTFWVTTSYLLTDGQGGNQSICQNKDGSPTQPELWKITVWVDWKGDGGHLASDGSRWIGGPGVQQTTLLAPQQAGQLPTVVGGQLAVPVNNATGTPFTAAVVPLVVIGSWVNGGSAQRAAGTVIEEAESTSTSGAGAGCVVFSDLDPTPGWQYTAYIGTYAGTFPSGSVAPFTGVVSSGEFPGIVNTSLATAVPPQEPPIGAPGLAVSTGTVVVDSAFTVDTGTTVSGSGSPASLFTTASCGAKCTAPAPAADLPITVSAHELLGDTDSAFDFDTVSSASAISSFVVYPYNDYQIWAGDSLDSDPNFQVSGTGVYGSPPPSPTPLDATQASTDSLSMTVYPVLLTETQSGVLPITATDLTSTFNGATPDVIALNTPSGSNVNTGIPLGQYQLSSPGYTVTPGYIWVTPTAIYYASSPMSTPTAGTSASLGTAISVNVQ